MFELLLIIYLLPVVIVAGLLLRLALLLLKMSIRIALWVIRKSGLLLNAAALLHEPGNVGLFPVVEACFNNIRCAVLSASVTANANWWSDVVAHAQLNAEPNAGLNEEVDGKHILTDLNVAKSVIKSDEEINARLWFGTEYLQRVLTFINWYW